MVVHRMPPRDFQALERRRRQAGRLFAKGQVALASIARELKVSRMSVSRWYRRWKRSGKGWRILSYSTPVFSFDPIVTVLCEIK
jgi:transposase-like protein